MAPCLCLRTPSVSRPRRHVRRAARTSVRRVQRARRAGLRCGATVWVRAPAGNAPLVSDTDDNFDDDDELGRQRRQNVRVDVQLPMVLHMAGREAPGRTRDVSATGIGFSTRLPIELEQRGEVVVEFDGWRFRKAFIVKFVKPILAGSQVGVQFEELTQEERERLVKQVFDVQRAQLQHTRRA